MRRKRISRETSEIDFFARRRGKQGGPSPAFDAIKRPENLAILSTNRRGHACFPLCDMKQDSNFCLGLVTAAPTGAVDSQEVRVVMAALGLIGVVQRAMMETAAAYYSQVI